MQYFPSKLRTSDEQQLNRIRNQIIEIRQLINKQLDNLEIEIFQKVDQLIQNENNKQLYQMEDLIFSQCITDPEYHLDEINKFLIQFTKCTQNVITHTKDEELNLLNFHNTSKLLQDMKIMVKTMFQNASKRITLNQKIVNTKQIQQQENDKSYLWKHKNIAKSNDREISFTFSKNFGLAENFLAISNIVLSGIYITPLFKGQNQFDAHINDQDKQVTFMFRVHEGIDMSQSIYQEQILIKHSSQTLVNNCYEIYLKEGVLLKQGIIYTLSIQSQNEENINLHMFQGKCVSFGGDIKFLGKETENMPQIVNIKQNVAQSCLPGLILAK